MARGSDLGRGFLYSKGTVTVLGPIANPAQYGWFGVSGQTPININDSDRIISSIREGAATDCVSAVYDRTKPNLGFVHIATPRGYPFGCGNCINNNQVAIGACWVQGYETDAHAYMTENGVSTDLNTLLPPNSGWQLLEANAINDAGQIVGSGLLNGVYRGFFLSPARTITNATRQSLLVEGIVATLFGGVPYDGPGWEILNGVRHPIDPWGPFLAWASLSEEEQDTLILLAMNRMVSSLSNPASGRSIRELVLGAMRTRVDDMIIALSREPELATVQEAGTSPVRSVWATRRRRPGRRPQP